MSGICGICQPGVTPERSRLDVMLEAHSVLPGIRFSSSLGPSIALGVAQRWELQALADIPGIRIAVDADLVNVDELRKLLNSEGIPVPEASIAEVIAYLYVWRGPEFLSMLRGTFAIALWDEKVQRLLLAIDRLGVQSLYWSVRSDGLFFSSRSSSIVAAQDGPATVNPVAVVQFLILSCVPAPMSIYAGVERLRPGQCDDERREEQNEQREFDGAGLP